MRALWSDRPNCSHNVSQKVNVSCVSQIGTEYDQAKVPPYNGNDPPSAPRSLKALLFPALLNKVGNKGTQGVRARYDAELLPIISIVRCPGRPVISVPDQKKRLKTRGASQRVRPVFAPKCCASQRSPWSLPWLVNVYTFLCVTPQRPRGPRA